MSATIPAAPAKRKWFVRNIAVPHEHGAWVFLFVPLLIGLVSGGQFRPASAVLILAALGAFLLRQPLVGLVKLWSGRRSSAELPAALLWSGLYGLWTLAAVLALVVMGEGFLLWLALPAVPVLAWNFWLVSRRAERRQLWVEVAGSGVLALTAPAAYWIGLGRPDPAGWLLWLLCWMQSAGSILYAYLRLDQRRLREAPSRPEQWRMGRSAVLTNLAVLVVVVVLAIAGRVPALLPLAFAIQPAEALWGTFHPAVRVKPARIGFRQLGLSLLFTALFLLLWV